MGKRGVRRVKSKTKAKDLTAARTSKVKGGVTLTGNTVPNVRLTGIKDGTSNTIMVGETAPPAAPGGLTVRGG